MGKAPSNPHRLPPEAIRGLVSHFIESNGGTMNATYRAIELSGPGKFSEVRKPLLDPGPIQLRIRFEVCEIGHPAAVTVYGLFPSVCPHTPEPALLIPITIPRPSELPPA